MSDIHINRAGQTVGIFSQTEVQAGLENGRFFGTDLAWRSGMETWKPLAQWPDFVIPVRSIPPVVAGAAYPPDVSGAMSIQAGDLPSWERKEELGFFTAFAATVKEVLMEPSATFSRLKTTGGYMTPFLYMLLTTIIGVGLGIGVQTAMQGVMGSMLSAQNPEIAKVLAAQQVGMGVGLLFALVLVPILLLIASFVGSAIWHVSLMVLGGANKPYEATYRVYCYVTGSSTLISLVPCCGGLAAIVWKVVSGSIGLAKVHEISTGKAVLAVLLPLLLCCGTCGVGLYFFVQSMMGNPQFMDAMNALNSSH